MAPNDIITPAMIDSAERGGACEPAIVWCRKQRRLTIRSLAKYNAEWCRWAAECAVKRGDYKAAERFAEASDDPGLARRWCAEVAAIRGDDEAAERFAKASYDPGLARRWCAKAAAHRGDYEAAERFASQSDDPGRARHWCAYIAAKLGDDAAAERFRKKINGTK